MYKDGWKAVTIHGNRMPWNFAGTFPFEKDVWELYNFNEDFSETNNLADRTRKNWRSSRRPGTTRHGRTTCIHFTMT